MRHVPSFANFVMVNLGCEAKPIAAQLEARGVVVRPLGFMGLPNAIRVTVGTEDDNANFLSAFGKIVGEERRANSKSESREPR